MNPNAIAPLTAFALAMTTAVFALARDPSRSLNRVYFAAMLVMAAEMLIEFGYGASVTREQAHFWWQADVVWPFIGPALLHFAFVFSGYRRALPSPVLYVLVYLPACLMAFAELTTDWLTGPPVRAGGGWTYGAGVSRPLMVAAVSWQMVQLTAALILVGRQCFASRNRWRRRQAAIIAVGLGIPTLSSLMRELVLPIWDIHLFDTGRTMYVMGGLILGYAIWRYSPFELTPRSALDSILAAMPDAVLLADEHGEVVGINRSAARLFGYSEERLLGRDIGTVLALPCANAPSAGTSTGHPRTSEGECDGEAITKQGDSVPVSVTWSCLPGPRRIGPGVVYIVRDITRRQEIAAELDRHRNRLETLVEQRTRELEESSRQLVQAQKMEALGQMAGGVAHDFNNLLTVILGNLGFAQDEATGEPLTSYLTEAEQAARRGAALARQLLVFSRRTPPNMQPLMVNEVLGEVAAIVRSTMDRRITLEVRTAERLPAVMADPGQLHQVLLNLSLNARDAIEQQRAAGFEQDPRIVLGSEDPVEAAPTDTDRPKNAYVCIYVEDTGCGMDEATIRRAFEPFFTTKPEGHGTGLGLATANAIIGRHGGWVDVRSTLGKGTVFRVYLPVESRGGQVQSMPGKPQNPIAKVPRGDETILLVDDEESIRKVGKTMLERLGYTVLLARDGVDALEVFRPHRDSIGLVLVDLSMPRMSGQEMIEVLQEEAPDVPILACSGYSDTAMIQSCLEKGAIGFLAKPFRLQEVAKCVREALDQASQN